MTDYKALLICFVLLLTDGHETDYEYEGSDNEEDKLYKWEPRLYDIYRVAQKKCPKICATITARILYRDKFSFALL